MIKATQTRDSFLSVGEFLKDAAEQSRVAERALRSNLHKVTEPYSLALTEIDELERAFVGLLANYSKSAPMNVLETRFQYTLDTVHADLALGPYEAVDRLISVNWQIANDLEEQARKVNSQSVEDALELLRRELETITRRISMIRITIGDC